VNILIEKEIIIKKIDTLNKSADEISNSDVIAAFKSAEEALFLSRDIDYKKGEIYALFYMGESLYRQGQIYDAMDKLRDSLTIADQIEENQAKTLIFTVLGNIHLHLGLHDLAFYYYNSALSIAEPENMDRSRAMLYNNIGETYRLLGENEKALESYNKCMEICDQKGFTRITVYTTVNIGLIDFANKDYQDGIRNFEKGLSLAKEMNNNAIEGFALRYLGLIYSELADYDDSMTYFNQALKVHQGTKEDLTIARILCDIAVIDFKKEKHLEALNYLNRANEIANKLQDIPLKISIYEWMSEVYQSLGDYKKACDYYELCKKARYEKEIQDHQHKLKSINFQIPAWKAIRENKNYQEINRELREKTDKLEKVTKELQRINKEIKAQSDMDGLTQIANRVRLDSYAQEMFELAYKKKKNIAFLIIDIDHFKEYNDFYGHLVGDEALIKLAKILKKASDDKEALAARFGGDEFVIVLYDINQSGVEKVAKEIAKTLKARKIKHEKSTVSSQLTVSIGVINRIPQKKSTYALFMDFADQALYQAKEKGRNQIEFYDN
jgi:diguanylate cyclase (GGDEF)-like protein